MRPAALAALATVALTAATAPAAKATPAAAARPRAWTALDDARACQPLAGGGFAVATGGGLAVVRADGRTRVLTSLDGLPETRVYAVAQQGDGLWVGTEAGAAFVSLAGAPKITRTVGAAPVSALAVTARGEVYLGTRGDGLLRLDSPRAAPKVVPSAATGTRVAAIAQSDGALYVAYGDGPLAKLSGGRLADVPGTPVHGQALAAVTTRRGPRLFVGALEGLFRVGGGVTQVASVDARGLAAMGSTLLLATYGDGVMRGDGRGALRSSEGAPKIARGVGVRGATRCVATTEGLFAGVGAGALHAIALPAGPPSNDVTALATSRSGRVALGTFDRGAAIVDHGVARRVDGLDAGETVNALAWQGDRLWLATVHGLVRVSPDGTTRRFVASDGLPSSYVRAVAVAPDSRVLVGTEAGPAIVEGDRATPLVPMRKGRRQPLDSPMHATWAVASGDDGTLYVGTSRGLYYGKDGRFARASVASGALEDDWVTALAIAREGVFVGTYAKGVTHLRFEEGAPKATHLGGGYVNAGGLTVKDGTLYAATMDHLLVRPASDDGARWEPRPAAAPGRDVTAVTFARGETWVASRRGIGIVKDAAATGARVAK